MKVIETHKLVYIETPTKIGETMGWIIRHAYKKGAEIRITFIREGTIQIDLLIPE